MRFEDFTDAEKEILESALSTVLDMIDEQEEYSDTASLLHELQDSY